MPTQPLPDNPSLENLRKQAKSLRKAYENRNPEALSRVREFSPHPDTAPGTLTLAAAQLVIARSYGVPSWSRLKQHLEQVRAHFWTSPAEPSTPESEPVEDRFVRLACLTYQADHPRRREEARKLLAANPSIARHSIYTAATVGDTAAAREILAGNPKFANVRGGPNNWEPLLYAAYSRLNSEAAGHSTLDVARMLLAHGADPNAGFFWDGRYLFTALTGVFGEGESGPIHQAPHQYCDEFARMLLEAGADPNDSQTLYNRMFTGGTAHLELLHEFGLGITTNNVWSRRLGPVLETPAQMLQQQMAWAVKYNQMERLRWLVDHGVDVNIPDTRFHETPYRLAMLNGNREAAQYLLDHGAHPISLSDLDSFAAACLTADSETARRLLAKNATLLNQLGHRRAELLNRAAEEDRRDAIRLMIELGFDLRHAPNALHHAAGGGLLEMVKLLIEFGADPTIRDPTYDATPMGWARYFNRPAVLEYLQQFEPSA